MGKSFKKREHQVRACRTQVRRTKGKGNPSNHFHSIGKQQEKQSKRIQNNIAKTGTKSPKVSLPKTHRCDLKLKLRLSIRCP